MYLNKMTSKKPTSKKVSSKEFKNIIKQTDINDISEINIKKYINVLKDKITINQYPLKLKMILTCEFTTPMAFDIIEAHYSHPIQVIQTQNNLTVFYDNLLDKFNAWIDAFQERGSGFVFNKIKSALVKQYKYNYQKASSYIPLQFKSSNIINVKNLKDNKCFTWSILAKFYPANDHKERVTKYAPYEHLLNMGDIDYPVRIKDISKVEKQNNININVFALDNQKDKQSIYPVYVSNVQSENIVDLLYIEENENTHYCLIKDLDSFMCDKNRHKSFTCRNCLQGFRREDTLIKHQTICYDNEHCKTIMPEPGKNILKFNNHHFKNRLPFAIYCDFEAYNIPMQSCTPDPNKSYIKPISKQEINSYGMYVHSDYPEIYKPQYFSYVGDDAVEKYVEKVMRIFKKITYKIHLNEKKKPILNNHEEDEFQEAIGCYICGEEFKESEKVREHDHLSGKYRGAACQSCNTKEGKATKLLPVFFHNGSNYDFHFLIEELMKYEDEYNKVKLLSKNSENYISIDYGSYYKKLRFLDSFRFTTKGLSVIAESMDDFPILEKEFKGDISLLKQKGFYPYEYIDDINKLKMRNLPSFEKKIVIPKNKSLNNIDKNNFMYKYCMKWYNYKKVSLWYSKLSGKDITNEDKKHILNVWEHYNCKSFLDYHNLYLKTDVLILADAFEKFRKFFIENHEIDPCYCYSAPGLTWQCGLKYTGIKLELLTDVDMLQMFENGIRGGFSGVLGPRHVKAFNKYTSNYDKDYRIIDEHEKEECLKRLKEGKNLNKFFEKNYLLYLDANNLYGWAMSQKLPTGDFKWEKDPDYYKDIPEGRGCIIECDLKYTKKCRNKTFKYPLAPEKMKIKKEELSDYQLKLLGDKPLGNEEKLFLTLRDKRKYIIHNSILKEYIKLGIKITKVYRTISFKESNWLAKYINFNTEQRTKSKSDFEKELWKLMNNSFYGKTLENIRGRSEIKLLTDKEEVKKYIKKPNFKDSIIFNNNFVAIVNNVTSVKFNKPIYLGQAILDYSKQLMYNFYYNVANELWEKNELVASDTDSIFLNVKTENIYKDMEEIKDELDTSGYPKDHPLYSEENKKVIGKFKDELNGEIMNEVVFLKSKAYSYTLTDLSEEKKLKGIGKTTIKKDINFNDYKDCLFKNKTKMNKMYTMNSSKHKMYVNEVNKISMSPFDDKRYILDNGIDTQPFGFSVL